MAPGNEFILSGTPQSWVRRIETIRGKEIRDDRGQPIYLLIVCDVGWAGGEAVVRSGSTSCDGEDVQ